MKNQICSLASYAVLILKVKNDTANYSGQACIVSRNIMEQVVLEGISKNRKDKVTRNS